VEAVLNTIARVGVIDEKLMGSNNWHLDMGYVCLHEQYVAQMGLAIDDEDYFTNYRKTLDYFRDNAISPDGNVKDRWAYIEEISGDGSKATYYRDLAEKCKYRFNQPVTKGGFWSRENNWYVYWRDKDGSIHGDNLVTPVNFMAIAYGI
jgi:hypothetical protein